MERILWLSPLQDWRGLYINFVDSKIKQEHIVEDHIV